MSPAAPSGLPALRRRAVGAALLLPLAAAACPAVRMPVAPGGLLVRAVQGRAQGVLVGLAQALQRRLGCPVVSALLPQQRLLQSFYQSFEADVLIPGSPLAYEDHTPHFVPLFKVSAHWVVRQVPSRPPQAQAALREGASLVLARHVSYGEDFDALVQDLDARGQVSWVADVGTALRMVMAQRVEGTLLSPTVAYAHGGDALFQALRFQPLPEVRPMQAGAAVSRRSMPEDLQQRVVAALRTLAREGEVEREFQRHFPPAVLALEWPTRRARR